MNVFDVPEHLLHSCRESPERMEWLGTLRGIITDLASRWSLTPGLVKNADGSMDVYFGPKAPPRKELNWVPTKAGGGFELMFRFYGPEKPLFDKTWKLPDIELMK